ncbi:hypothetical protein BZB76_0933 [Actinomadura pelletieri DSM 43383]|uniref:Uncharacterized protein n=1 Tax=Actinomadura pelletieri DSM 43383 TaxID=1120940 RepID=A0A495QZG9_9ACTN|nr:hypothetical protein BZB76_0933 [Actinomadura pelletieri DSM 43383]
MPVHRDGRTAGSTADRFAVDPPSPLEGHR